MTNEQIEKYRAIVESHSSWVSRLSDEAANSIHWLNNLRTIIDQHDELQAKNKRIAELERERDELIIIANTAINISQRPHPYITDAKNRLEQLRKGASDD